MLLLIDGADRQTDGQTLDSFTMLTTCYADRTIMSIIIGLPVSTGLQCFDAVGWAAGRASGL